MDAVTRYWKRLREDQAQMWLLVVIAGVGLVSWFVITIRAQRQADEQVKLWSTFHELREDPIDETTLDNQELRMMQFMVQQRVRTRLEGLRREQRGQIGRNQEIAIQAAEMQTARSEALGRKVPKAQELLAAMGDAEKNKEALERFTHDANLYANTPVGPWLWWHIGNLRYAAGDYGEAREAYQRAQQLLDGQAGHALTDNQFNWLQRCVERASAQEAVAAKLAKQKQTPRGSNPKLTITTTEGKVTIELFIAENRQLVQSICELAEAGVYDGHTLDDKTYTADFMGRPQPLPAGVIVGPPASEDSDAGATIKTSERRHVRGTVSMALQELASAPRASSSRFIIVTANPDEPDFMGNKPNLGMDARNPVIGKVVESESDKGILDRLSTSTRVISVELAVRGGYQGRLIRWPAAPAKQDGDKKDADKKDADKKDADKKDADKKDADKKDAGKKDGGKKDDGKKDDGKKDDGKKDDGKKDDGKKDDGKKDDGKKDDGKKDADKGDKKDAGKGDKDAK